MARSFLKCQEKPSGVYKMQENAWRPGLRFIPRWGSLQCSKDAVAGGEWAGCSSPRTPPSLSAVQASVFGLTCLRCLIFRPPRAKILATVLRTNRMLLCTC